MAQFGCFFVLKYTFHVHLSISIVSSLLRPSSIRPPFDNGFDQQRLNMACFFPVRYGVKLAFRALALKAVN